MYRNVIVPLDGSPFAERALRAATAIATRRHAQLVLIRVHDTHPHLVFQPPSWEELVRDEERAYLERQAANLLAGGCTNVTWRALEGVPEHVVSSCAADSPDALIVMSTHGRTGIRRTWLGSVADAIVRHTRSPVLLLRPELHEPSPAEPLFENVLVALDGSGMAERVLTHAMAFAETFGAGLLLFRAAPASHTSLAYEYLRAVRAMCVAQAPSITVTIEVQATGDPGEAIQIRARRLERPLIALGSHGRGVSRYVFGSVADEVLRGKPQALLMIRSPAGVPLPPSGDMLALKNDAAPTV